MTNMTMDAVRQRFDGLAATWDENPARVALAGAVVAAMRAAVPLRADMQALDFGAGTGLVSLGLSPFVARLTAADASEEMLRVLDAKLKAACLAKVRTLHCDINRVPLPAAQFDLVASSMTLHHLPDVPHVLQRLRPCLKPGGWIALADLDAEDGTFHADMTGVFHRGFERAQMCAWLQAAGFTDVAARDAHRMTRPVANNSTREYGIFLVTGRASD